MKYSSMLLGVLVAAAFAISSCSIRLADLTVVTTKNVNLDRVDLDSLPQTKNITGRDSKFIFLALPGLLYTKLVIQVIFNE